MLTVFCWMHAACLLQLFLRTPLASELASKNILNACSSIYYLLKAGSLQCKLPTMYTIIFLQEASFDPNQTWQLLSVFDECCYNKSAVNRKVFHQFTTHCVMFSVTSRSLLSCIGGNMLCSPHMEVNFCSLRCQSIVSQMQFHACCRCYTFIMRQDDAHLYLTDFACQMESSSRSTYSMIACYRWCNTEPKALSG